MVSSLLVNVDDDVSLQFFMILNNWSKIKFQLDMRSQSHDSDIAEPTVILFSEKCQEFASSTIHWGNREAGNILFSL